MDRPRQRQKDKKGILTEDQPFETETDQENIASKSTRAETHWHISGCNLHILLIALEASKCTFGFPAS